MDRKQALKRWLWYFSIPAAAVLLYKVYDNFDQALGLVGKLFGILGPFVGGFVLAFFMFGPSRWLESRFLQLKGKAWGKLARPLSLTIVYLVFIGLLALIMYLLVPALITSLIDLGKNLPGYLSAAMVKIEEFTHPDSALGQFGLGDRVSEMYASLTATLTQMVTTENILAAVKGVGTFASSLVDVVIAFAVSLYMLSGRESLLRALKNFLSLFIKPRTLAALGDYSVRSAKIFSGYFYGALLDALCVGAVVSVGLLIFRVPYAVLLGMTLGLMNMIPYFGAILGSVGIALVTLLTTNLYTAIGVVIYVVVVQQIDANIIQPRVVGNSVGLRPIYVLLSITVFGGLFGFWGILLAPPLMAIVQMFVRDASAAKAKREAAESVQKAEE